MTPKTPFGDTLNPRQKNEKLLMFGARKSTSHQREKLEIGYYSPVRKGTAPRLIVCGDLATSQIWCCINMSHSMWYGVEENFANNL